MCVRACVCVCVRVCVCVSTAVVGEQHEQVSGQRQPLARVQDRRQRRHQRPVQVVAEPVDAERRYWHRTDLLRYRPLQGRCRRHQAHQEGPHPDHAPGPCRVQRGQCASSALFPLSSPSVRQRFINEVANGGSRGRPTGRAPRQVCKWDLPLPSRQRILH